MKEKLVRFLKRILSIHSTNVLNSEKDTLAKTNAAIVDGLIQGITSKTNNAVKNEWYFKRFAGEARNKFCYPKGIWCDENTYTSCKDCPMGINEKGENNESK